jgi:hypothetical protein
MGNSMFFRPFLPSILHLQNTFSDRLSKFSFNPFKMLVPDFMHEFELGVFKAFFIHLLRILHAHGDGAIQALNEW